MKRYAIITGTTVVDTTDNEYGAIDYAINKFPNAKYLHPVVFSANPSDFGFLAG